MTISKRTRNRFPTAVAAVFSVLTLALVFLVSLQVSSVQTADADAFQQSKPLVLHDGTLTAGTNTVALGVTGFTVVGSDYLVYQQGDKVTVLNVSSSTSQVGVLPAGTSDVQELRAADSTQMGFTVLDASTGQRHLYLVDVVTGAVAPVLGSEGLPVDVAHWVAFPSNEVLAYLTPGGSAYLYDTKFKFTTPAGQYTRLGGFVNVALDAQLWGEAPDDPSRTKVYSTGTETSGSLSVPKEVTGQVKQIFTVNPTTNTTVWVSENEGRTFLTVTSPGKPVFTHQFAGIVGGTASATLSGGVIAVPVTIDGATTVQFVSTVTGSVIASQPGESVHLTG